jgi:hypothetical protein
LLIFLTLPMALVGGVLANYLPVASSRWDPRRVLTVSISARSGILLVNHCQHLET